MEYFEDFEIPENDRETINVEGPSGAIYDVLHDKEKEYWNSTAKKYLSDYKFTNVSDLQDLDRVISLEMLLYRYQQWISMEHDYWGESVDTDALNKTYKDKSGELRLIKKSLGIEKVARDKDQGDSIAAYIENLRRRAHEFGVMRNEQAVKAITLFQELAAKVTFYDNCTPDERKEEHIEIEDLVAWIRDTAIPEFNKIDEEFRKTNQKYWIAEM